MSKQSPTTAATTTLEDVQKLRNAVNFMDCLSKDGFSEIAAVAKLALKSLENPDGYLHPENIAYALKVIWGKADDIQNCISYEAENLGCGYVDDAAHRRSVAYCAARDQERTA